MGADGHIRIMDYDKFLRNQSLNEAEEKEFKDLIKDSMTYFQNATFEGCESKHLVTNYHGDNLYCMSNLYNLVSYGWQKGDWEDSFYFDGFLNEVKKSFDPERFLQLAQYLWKDCHVNNWEVWT